MKITEINKKVSRLQKLATEYNALKITLKAGNRNGWELIEGLKEHIKDRIKQIEQEVDEILK
jgi:hypothetical protein